MDKICELIKQLALNHLRLKRGTLLAKSCMTTSYEKLSPSLLPAAHASATVLSYMLLASKYYP